MGAADVKTMRAGDIPRSCEIELPDDPDSVVTVSIGPAGKPSERRLVDFIGSGKGIYPTRAEADIRIRKLRDEWQD